MKILFEKLKEAAMSVLPVVAIVLVLICTPLVNLSNRDIIVFLVCTAILIFGIALFTIGAEIAMTPMGTSVGSGLAKKRKLGLLLIVSFLLGLLITIAEPDLTVLAEQVGSVINGTTLIVGISVGVGGFICIAILKILFKKTLATILMLFYMLLFALGLLVVINGNVDLLPLSFDAGGVTTGPITVPFLMALGVGIATVLSGKHAREDSFGFVALCSVGPILVVLFLSVFSKSNIEYEVPSYIIEGDISSVIIEKLFAVTLEVVKAMGFLVASFLVCQFTFLKMPLKHLRRIFVGIIYTVIGLILFLTSVNIGYMPVGFMMGTQIADFNKNLLIPLGFLMGLLVVLAEPAVHILKKQVEDITGGYITKRSMTIGLSIGVGISIGLAMLRIIYDFNIMYVIIPGYFISLGLSLFVPKIYTAIAFDSGGVASGPMSSTFILPFAIGACLAIQGEAAILRDGFGVVAFIAMTPLITIQLLGFKAIVSNKVKEKIAMKRILDDDDEQIIDFI